jgi:hypothetical protein
MAHHLSRRLALIIATLTLAMGIPLGIALAAHFGDVPNSHPFHSDIAAISDAGVTSGCGGGNFCPDREITRAEMAAFLNRLGALGPTKVPVVNADRLDGLNSSDFLQGRAGGLAYVWANNASSASYTPSTTYSYSSAGGPITITRSGVGNYTVTFEDLSLGRGNIQVTKYGTPPGVCQVAVWSGSSVIVRCYDMAGAAADFQFTLLFMD